jgi:hypothetical protein
MAFNAIVRTLHVEGLLAVVALAAEVSLGDLGHVHLVRTLGHLKDLIMASRALDALAFDVGFVAEDHRPGALGRELDVTAAYLLGHCGERQNQTHNKQYDNEHLFHRSVPPLVKMVYVGDYNILNAKNKSFFMIIMLLAVSSGIMK